MSALKLKVAKLMAQFVPRAVFEQLKTKYSSTEDFGQLYFSQEGEDILLRRYFNFKNNGFFVDIGAHHATRFSNTYLLYKMGWHGINIDATVGSMQSFNETRTRDINIEAAISDRPETLTFYCFDEPALNTFDEQKALMIAEKTNYKLLSKQIIKTRALSEILEQYLHPHQEIDFFSIDAEGFDFKILKGNNWVKYKPKVIVIETEKIDIGKLVNDEVSLYLCQLGYRPFAKTFKSVFYAR